MRLLLLSLFVLLWTSSCEESAVSCGCGDTPLCDPGTYESGGECVPIECQEEKLSFTQETGCANDGSVEFCIPSSDATAILATLHSIDPAISCAPGGGRAGCVDTEQLCFLPTSSDLCDAQHGALTPLGWDRVCRVSELDYVDQIVPTFYE